MKEYIGDGAYAELLDDGTIILTAEDGIAVTNRVVLESDVWNALLAYVRRTAPKLIGAPV